jgi:hypothetical protein
MKLRNCFIDEEGNVWKTETLIEKSVDLPVFMLPLDSISLEEVLRWKLTNLRDYYVHFKRVSDADITIPIILRDDGYIMDGWHRVIKALYDGVKYIPAKKFIKNPDPDLIV